jgi:hypothetical protein
MKTVESPFSTRLVYGLSIASVAIAATFGAPAVRADSETSLASLHDMVVAPIMSALHAVEARLAGVEAFAGSFASRQITAQELCIADQSGAQTCITKAQLDALLGITVRTAAPAAAADATTALFAQAIVTEVVVEPLVSEPAMMANTDSVTKVMEAENTGIAASEIAAAEVTVKDSMPIENASPAIEPVAPAVEPATVVSADTAKEVTEVEVTATIEVTPSETPVVETPVIETPVIETTGIGTTPAETPVEAVVDEPRAEEPVTTGSITPANSGDVLVSHPDVEISKAVDAPVEE